MFNLLWEKIIGVNICSTAKKLIFQIMPHHHANPFGNLTPLPVMKISGNITRNDTPARTQN
jgi:hypothetical protein